MSTLPFRINWAESVQVAYNFKTDVLLTSSNREQRRALILNPRLTLTATVEPLTGPRAAAYRRNLLAEVAEDIALPDPMRSVRVIGVSGARLDLTVLPSWITGSATLAVVDEEGVTETVTVSSVGTSSVTVIGLTIAAPVLVRPVLVAAFTDWSAALATTAISSPRVRLSVRPGTVTAFRADPAFTYDGREVLRHRPNWANVPSVNFEQQRDEADFGFGLTNYTVPQNWGAARSVTALTFLERPTAEVGDLVGFFIRQRGRAREFFAPTFETDITPTAGLVAGETLLHCADSDLAALVDHPQVRHIVVSLSDGRRLYRKIVSIAGSTITVDRPWLYSEPLTTIRFVSFLLLHRFASDQVVAEAVTETVALARVGMVSLPYFATEYALPVMSQAMIDYDETYGENLDLPTLYALHIGINQTIPDDTV